MGLRKGCPMATVLVVEKQPNMRLLMEMELADAGHRGILVADEGEAADALRFDRPDVAVVGVGWPPEDEVQTLLRLKQACPDLPLILFSCKENAGSPSMSQRVDAWVEKNSRMDALVDEINRQCQAVPAL